MIIETALFGPPVQTDIAILAADLIKEWCTEKRDSPQPKGIIRNHIRVRFGIRPKQYNPISTRDLVSSAVFRDERLPDVCCRLVIAWLGPYNFEMSLPMICSQGSHDVSTQSVSSRPSSPPSPAPLRPALSSHRHSYSIVICLPLHWPHPSPLFDTCIQAIRMTDRVTL